MGKEINAITASTTVGEVKADPRAARLAPRLRRRGRLGAAFNVFMQKAFAKAR